MTKKLRVRLPDIFVILCCAAALWAKIYWLFAWLIIPYLIALLIIYASKRIRSQKFEKAVRISIKILLIILYSAICKLYILDLYRVSGDSMDGTLKDGDVLLINKLAYGPSEPKDWSSISWIRLLHKTFRSDKDDHSVPATRKKGYSKINRNDIVVYELFPGYFVVKRCIGLPGDTLQLKNDSVHVNNHLTPFPAYSMSHYRIRFYQQESISNFLNTIPKNYIITMYPDSGYILAKLPFYEAKKLAAQPGMRLERILNDQIEGKRPYFLPGKWTVNNMGPLTIPGTDFYYMLGDNRQVSEDSRYLGYVPRKNIIGKVMLILYSHANGTFNWTRLLNTVD